MKKLLAIVAIFCMTSTAFCSAAVCDWTPSVSVAEAGDVVTISLISDVDVSGFGVRGVVDNASPMGAAAVIADSIHPNFTVAVSDGTGYLVNSGNALISRESGNALSGTMNPFGGSPAPANEVLVSFDYAIPDVPVGTVVTINEVDTGGVKSFWAPMGGTNQNEFGAAKIEVIPEPMTMTLLGLGGLGLLRRRRA